MKTIEISDSVHQGLAELAIGFGDTPNSVIERLLNEVKNKSKKPDLKFFPEDEARFKTLLMRDKKAEVALYKENDDVEVIVWQATRIDKNSNLRANIWSGHLRNWKEKGILKAEFSIYEKPIDAYRDENFFNLCVVLSSLINVPYRFLVELEFEHSDKDNAGAKELVIEFHSGQNLTLIENNPYFDIDSNRLVVPQSDLNYPLD